MKIFDETNKSHSGGNQFDRRQFIKLSVVAAAASVAMLGMHSDLFAATPRKRILVLGGTMFLGPALVEAAIASGHDITLFNRGVTNPTLFPYLEKLKGFRSVDRSNQDLSALAHRKWDAVIDVWPNEPELSESAAELLKDHTDHYLYVSSIAAYDGKGYASPGLTESGDLIAWDAQLDGYKRGKAESERRLHRIIGEKLTIVRPGPIKGARDRARDLYTWLERAGSAGQHIGPGDGLEYVQLVDVKDVGRFLVQAVEEPLYGVFNLTSEPMTFRGFLQACKSVMRSDAEFVWIPQSFLHAQVPDSDNIFPLWQTDPRFHAIFQISSAKAFKAGWQPRSFRETAMDCLDFFNSLDPSTNLWQDALTPAVERRVIQHWSARAP